MKYDPMRMPDAGAWLAADEAERLLAVEDFHRQASVRMPNHRLHAAIHTVVENQIAEGGDIPTAETLRRLMAQGLDRHDAIHAIGRVLSAHMYEIMNGKGTGDANARYFQELRELTAEK